MVGLHKLCQLFEIFSICFVYYESEQGCHAFMFKDPYYVGGMAWVLKYLVQGTIHILNIATKNSDKLKLV
jgi:hypothetical protein